MKNYCIIAIIFLSTYTLTGYSQKREVGYQAEIGGGGGSERLPFWLHSNTFDKISDDTYLWGSVSIFTPYRKQNTRAFDYTLKFEGTGALGQDDNRIFINQLHGNIRWQNLTLELGITNPEIIYDGLSSTNGDILYSTNSRSLPGINLRTWDFIKLPWYFQCISFKAQYGEYMMIDDRYAGNQTRLHHKMLDIRFTIIPQFSIEFGLDHYAQWAGRTEKDGKLPASVKDYLRVVFSKAGDDNAPKNEVNKLGNHIGKKFLKLRYHNDRWGTECYFQHLFEDGSGEKFKNHPDGLYGLYFIRKKSTKWLKSILYEFYYTKNQSGPYHNHPVTGEVVGGNDNYFNNGIYQSGWTYFGNVIGSPFFLPKPKEESGIVRGVINNRFYAHHLGISGDLPGNIQYKLKMSYTRNWGTYSIPLLDANGQRTSKPQLNFGLELVTLKTKLPFQTSLNIGFDEGDLLKHNFGVMLKLFKTGIF